MNRLKNLLLGLPAAALVASAVTLPVYAHQGSDDATETVATSTENSSTDSNSGSHSGRKTVIRTSAETETEGADDSLRSRGMKALEQAKKEHKEHKTQTQREKVCKARKNGIEKRTGNVATHAQRHLTHIDDVFTKLKAYKTDKNLTAPNWDTLVQTAIDAQTKATDSVSALTSNKPTVDCTSDTLLTDLATYKEATTQARKDLIAYRKAVQNLIHVLMSAKTDDTTEGGTQ
jgi:hypothetical protein